MRKILLIALTLTLVLSLCAGCNSTRVIYDDDFDDEAITITIGGVTDDDVDDPVEEPDDPPVDDPVDEPDDPPVEEPDDPPVDEPDDPPSDPVDEELPKVWPAGHLPQGFPEYPDGEIYRVKVNTVAYDMNVSLYIYIDESSKGTFGKYKTALKDAGWKLTDMGEVKIENQAGYWDYECWSIEKDGISGDVSYYMPDDTVEIIIY